MIPSEFMYKRLMVAAIRKSANRRDLAFGSKSDDWIIELRRGNERHRMIGFRFDLNDSVASQIAQDKVATHIMLATNNIPSVYHHLVRRELSTADRNIMSEWGSIIIKPLTGSGGHDIRLFSDLDKLASFVSASVVHAWAAAPLVPIENETRIILLDGEVLLSYEKEPIEINGIKMFNLGLGGKAMDVEPSAEQVKMAQGHRLPWAFASARSIL